jgi:hypothetical protein
VAAATLHARASKSQKDQNVMAGASHGGLIWLAVRHTTNPQASIVVYIYIYSIEVVAVSVDKPAGGSAECVSSSGPASLNGQTSNCHVRWDCRTGHQWKCSGFFFSF